MCQWLFNFQFALLKRKVNIKVFLASMKTITYPKDSFKSHVRISVQALSLCSHLFVFLGVIRYTERFWNFMKIQMEITRQCYKKFILLQFFKNFLFRKKQNEDKKRNFIQINFKIVGIILSNFQKRVTGKAACELWAFFKVFSYFLRRHYICSYHKWT